MKIKCKASIAGPAVGEIFEVLLKVHDFQLKSEYYLIQFSNTDDGCAPVKESDKVLYQKAGFKYVTDKRIPNCYWLAKHRVEELPTTNRAATSLLSSDY